MTKRNVTAALEALIAKNEGITSFAKSIGYSRKQVWAWMHTDAEPPVLVQRSLNDMALREKTPIPFPKATAKQ